MNVRIYKDLEQGSESWLEARRGIITASVIGGLITQKSRDALTVDCPKCEAAAFGPCISAARKTPTPIKTVHDERSAIVTGMPRVLEVADNETSRGIIHTLAAERITGHVEYVHPTFDMQRGSEDEPFARDVYREHFAPVEEIGFMVRDFGSYRIGFSPDGLVDDDGLIEIKSRKAKEQIATVLLNRVPTYNLAQIHTGMLVADRSWCDYVSFSAGLPLWRKRIERDPKWDAVIKDAASAFEINVTNIVGNFTIATAHLPMTERRPDYEEVTLQL